MIKVGIDAITFDVPKIYLPIRELAKKRNIEPDKLEKGLGLLKMAFPDVHQDSIVFASNALEKLFIQESIKPKEITRIYVGSESGVDAAKPIGTYLLSNLEQKFGEDSFNHCDTVDLTFACIGGVDALLNCLDYVRLNPKEKAIVVCTDFAKYDLSSSGEYTQGVGAIALLISSQPRILSIDPQVGISTKGVFDFFKPRRIYSKEEITGKKDNPLWMNVEEEQVEIYKDQPVFDGQYSNFCYQERIKQAYFHLKEKLNENDTLYTKWHNIIVHLPYSFQGRRMFSEIYAIDSGLAKNLSNDPQECAQQLKEISKTEEYKTFVNSRFAPAEVASSEIGNMYTGSIFMGLASTLYYMCINKKTLNQEKLGFLAYGSGSKSKVFQGIIEKGWEMQVSKLRLFESLEERTAIDMDTYESLYKKEKRESVLKVSNEWILDKIEEKNPLLLGARYYKFVN